MKKMQHNLKEVKLEFKLPEFKKEDIKVKFGKNSFAIKAEKNLEKSVQRKDFFHQEKSQKAFSYSTTLPGINPKKAKAEFRKGILKISAPKI